MDHLDPDELLRDRPDRAARVRGDDTAFRDVVRRLRGDEEEGEEAAESHAGTCAPHASEAAST